MLSTPQPDAAQAYALTAKDLREAPALVAGPTAASPCGPLGGGGRATRAATTQNCSDVVAAAHADAAQGDADRFDVKSFRWGGEPADLRVRPGRDVEDALTDA